MQPPAGPAEPLTEVPSQPPAEEPTTDEPAPPQPAPGEQPPVEVPPVEDAPAGEPSVETPPTEEPPVEEPPAADAHTAADLRPAPADVAAAAEVLVAVRTRRQVAAAITWNALVVLAVLLALVTIGFTVAGILGAQL